MEFNENFTTTTHQMLLLPTNNSINNSINNTISTIFTNATTSTIIASFDPTLGKVIELIILCFVCVMTLLGNSLVILAFIKGPRSIRTHTNYFVVNLAVCDFLVGCLSLPFWICVKLSKCVIKLKKFLLGSESVTYFRHSYFNFHCFQSIITWDIYSLQKSLFNAP